MKYILIADAGSTTTTWSIISCEGEEIKRFSTQGINAINISDKVLGRVIDFVRIQLFKIANSKQRPVENRRMALNGAETTAVESIYYYGAGCSTEASIMRMQRELSLAFNCQDVHVASDMVGASIALSGDERSVVCILGTGSNSCLYDGNKIVANTPSLGYILGDEGGGVSIGKRLLSDYFKGLMPKDTEQRFLLFTNADKEEVINNVYNARLWNRIRPNAYIASFAKAASSMIDDPYMQNIVSDEFNRFLTRNVMAYPNVKELKIGFVGSVAVAFSDILKEEVQKLGLQIGEITAEPIDNLVNYHIGKLANLAISEIEDN